MENATNSLKRDIPSESPIKHTAGGEIPDLEKMNFIRRRIHRFQAGAPLTDFVLPIFVVGLIGFGTIYLWRSTRT